MLFSKVSIVPKKLFIYLLMFRGFFVVCNDHTHLVKNKTKTKQNTYKKQLHPKKKKSRIQYGNTACGEACRVHLFVCTGVCVPSMEERLGSMVTAPTATSSSWWIGLLLAPQLSDPIHRKWPTWLALLVALRTPLQGHSCVNLERTREVCAI